MNNLHNIFGIVSLFFTKAFCVLYDVCGSGFKLTTTHYQFNRSGNLLLHKPKKNRFVHFHSLQSLLSQLPTTLVNWGLLYWLLQIYIFHNSALNNAFYAYLIFTIVSNLLYFVFSLVAAAKARKGNFFYFLFFGSYSYNRVYRIENNLDYENEKTKTPQSIKNKPPF